MENGRKFFGEYFLDFYPLLDSETLSEVKTKFKKKERIFET